MFEEETKTCLKCGSENVVKRGKVFNTKNTVWKQRYFCNNCKHKFVEKKMHLCDNYEPPEFVYQSKEPTPTDWKNYDKAQLNEKPMVFDILNDLIDMFSFKQIRTNGRPIFNTKDMLFGMLVKIYNKNSARRTISDLKLLQQLGYIEKVPSYSTLMAHFNKTDLKPILEKMIELAALPLKDVETDFAADSTGFSTSQFGHWFDEKWGEEKEKRVFRKAHIMTGVLTNTITTCIVTRQDGEGTGDTTQYVHMLYKTAINFNVKEVSADMAYSSSNNLTATFNAGAIPYIPFKKRVTGNGNGLVWRKMWLYSKYNPQEFFEHYHKRSNVESTFSMIKQKFNSFLMTKNYKANVNEILCKVIAHNICCLISAYYELNLEKAFQTKAQETAKIKILI